MPRVHGLHRTKCTIVDLGWRFNTAILSAVCDGSAALATGATLTLLVRF